VALPLRPAIRLTPARTGVAAKVATVLAVLALLVAVAGLLLHYVGFGSNPFMAVAAFAVYPMLAAPIALLLLLAARYWLGALVAVIVLAVCVFTQLPLLRAQSTPAHSEHLTVMTSNLRLGLADPDSLVDAVRRHGVQVLMTEEMTDTEVARLQAAGLNRLLPYSSLDPSPAGIESARGTGVWSKFPITSASNPPGFFFHMVVARIKVPGVSPEPTFVGLHLAGPWPDAGYWSHDINTLPSTLRAVAAADPTGSVIVGGDFNATWDTAQFRSLLTGGYHDAAEQAGAGWTRSYHAGVWYPPFIAIDHVLTRNAVASSAKTVTVSNSDHRALLVDVAVPTS
jgi:endonuclease/exonuclease/phosphatase (EEP) superfamily protein YafD